MQQELKRFTIFKTLTPYLLFYLILIISNGCVNKEDSNETEDSNVLYSFFAAGHTYGKPYVDNVGFHPPFKQKFDLIRKNKNIEFGVLTGDMVIEGTELNWEEVDSDIALLEVPIYKVVGNHDMSDRDLYESRYGKTYYSFTNHQDLFIVLDPLIDGWSIKGDQLDFLKNTLHSHKDSVDNVFVFFHQLIWRNSENIYKNIWLNSFYGKNVPINYWDEIEPMFRSLKNSVFMISGDVGAFYTGDEFVYHQYENITLIASGMGAGVRDNFIIINVNKNKSVDFDLIALNHNEDIDALGRLQDYKLKSDFEKLIQRAQIKISKIFRGI